VAARIGRGRRSPREPHRREDPEPSFPEAEHRPSPSPATKIITNDRALFLRGAGGNGKRGRNSGRLITRGRVARGLARAPVWEKPACRVTGTGRRPSAPGCCSFNSGYAYSRRRGTDVVAPTTWHAPFTGVQAVAFAFAQAASQRVQMAGMTAQRGLAHAAVQKPATTFEATVQVAAACWQEPVDNLA